MTDLDIDLDALETLAKAATPGPWHVAYGDNSHAEGSPACRGKCGKGELPSSTRKGTREEGAEGKEIHVFYLTDYVEDITSADKHVVCTGHDYDEGGSVSVEDAAFIAAFNPATAIALLTRLRHEQQRAEQAEAQLAALTARIEQLIRWEPDIEKDYGGSGDYAIMCNQSDGDWLSRADVLAAVKTLAQPETPPPTSTPGEQP